jgi:hypothetical protein
MILNSRRSGAFLACTRRTTANSVARHRSTAAQTAAVCAAGRIARPYPPHKMQQHGGCSANYANFNVTRNISIKINHCSSSFD